MKKSGGLDNVISGILQLNGNQMVSGQRSIWRLGAQTRIVAVILALASAVACGGGGGSISGKAQFGARISTSSLTFGNQAVTTTSATQTVTLTNTGILDLGFSAVTMAGTNAGDFIKTADTCSGAAILPNTTCAVSVSFAPSAAGSRSATLQINDDAPGSPQVVNLSGTGTGPIASMSLPSITFGNQAVNTTSGAQTETVTNTGSVGLAISAVTIAGTNAGDFARTADTCTGSTVASNATCMVSITFTPSQLGGRSATLNFTDNASGSLQTINMSGPGAGPGASLSNPSVSFGNQPLNATSTAQTETVTNSGTANLTISTVTMMGTNAADFARSADTCTGATMAPNATCAVSVKFTPSGIGSRSASLSFADNAFNSPQAVDLSGTGTGSAVGLSAPSLNFATVVLGSTSTVQTETITNSGNINLTITTAALTGANAGDYSKTADTCTGATVTPNNTCAVSVKFAPSAIGNRSASLNFTDNASNSPQVVSLSGIGTGPAASLSSPNLNFSDQLLSTTSGAQSETVTNTGVMDLVISTVTVAGTNPGDFSKTADTCTGATLTPNNACAVSVKFTPSALGSRSATLSFSDNAADSPQTVNMSGMGTAPAVGLSSPSLNFGNQGLNAPSDPMTETVTNTGTANLGISTVTVTGANASDFAKSADACTGATVLPNSACAVSVVLTPSGVGTRSATLSFADNASNSPQPVGLSGSGVVPVASLSATSLSFSSQVLNTTSVAQAETLTNTGVVNVVISNVTFTGTNASDFAKGADTCTGATLTPSSTCTVSVTFAPSATGNRSAILNFTDNAGGSPQTSNLGGIGSTQLAGVFTNRYDNARTGLNNEETVLTPSNVTVGQIGRLFVLTVDGQVYAQPLYMQNVAIPSQGTHNVVFVATQHDSVYAFDADGPPTTPLWQVSFLDSSNGVTTVPCADVYGTDCDINPEIGITSTPVIDPASGTLYVTAKTREPLGTASCTANGSYDYCYRLHALDVTTGAEKLGGPVVITGNVPGTSPVDSVNGTVTFGAFRHLQRPALLLLNGLLYIGFGSHGDNDPYHGWLMAYDATTLQQKAIFNVTPNGTEGAIWQGGGGISADESGYIYVVTANGDFNADSGGGDYSDSVLKMQIRSGQFQVLDYFTPFNQATLAEDDLDLGSSQALILPDQPGSDPHLLVTGGKDGRVWILNRDNLGHIQTNDAGALQIIPGLSDLLFGGVTYFNGNLYLQELGDFLFQFPLLNGMAQTPVQSTYQSTGYPNSYTVISSNGTNNGVLWLVDTSNYGGGGLEVLRAFDAGNVANEIYDSNQAANGADRAGAAVKFATPTVANGKVYVGTSGTVAVYGLLPP